MGNSLFMCRRGPDGYGKGNYTTTVIHDPAAVYRLSSTIDGNIKQPIEENDDEEDSEEEAEHSVYENRPDQRQQQQQHRLQDDRKSPLTILTNPLYEEDDNGDSDSVNDSSPAVDKTAAVAAAEATLEKVRAEAARQQNFLLEQSHPEAKKPDPVLL